MKRGRRNKGLIRKPKDTLQIPSIVGSFTSYRLSSMTHESVIYDNRKKIDKKIKIKNHASSLFFAPFS